MTRQEIDALLDESERDIAECFCFDSGRERCITHRLADTVRELLREPEDSAALVREFAACVGEGHRFVPETDGATCTICGVHYRLGDEILDQPCVDLWLTTRREDARKEEG
jgi:hypothetical protein